MLIPEITFHTRVRDKSIGGDNPYRWEEMKSTDIFAGNVFVFSLPGAFTPTCTNEQLPAYEKMYDEFRQYVDEVYCCSVNDSFVMNAWAKSLGIEKVKLIPDGSGTFTKFMNQWVEKDNLGFGMRSWRSGFHITNNRLVRKFQEEHKRNNADDDPYHYTRPEEVLQYLERWHEERENMG